MQVKLLRQIQLVNDKFGQNKKPFYPRISGIKLLAVMKAVKIR